MPRGIPLAVRDTSNTPDGRSGRVTMKRRTIRLYWAIILAAVGTVAFTGGPVAADPVIEWNLIAKTAVVDHRGGGGVAVFAYMHGAMYDAVNAINGRFTPYAWRPWWLDRTASQEAAVVSAAYHVLVSVYPAQKAFFDGAYAGSLAEIPEGDAKERGLLIGERAARAMLAHRAGDGFLAPVPYEPGSGPGVWQPTPPAFLPALNPWMPRFRPFTLTSPWQFRAPGPPALDSARWAEGYNESRAYGAAVGSLRTPEQTEQGRFWTEPPPAQYTRIWRDLATAYDLNLVESARFFAMLSIALMDSAIAVWESKFHYGFWRPVTAIRAGDTDGNDATEADPDWSSAQITPNHPEYPAAHASSAGAISETIAQFFGTRHVRIVLSSAATGTRKTIFHTDDLAQELIDARVYGGMHYRFSCEDGSALGRQVGRWVAEHYFAPTYP